MNHRKSVHPSDKKCRNLPGCKFKTDCWYVHDDPMETNSTDDAARVDHWNFKCNFCEQKFLVKNDFMTHKKTYHQDKVIFCKKILTGSCMRKNESCWYSHSSEK